MSVDLANRDWRCRRVIQNVTSETEKKNSHPYCFVGLLTDLTSELWALKRGSRGVPEPHHYTRPHHDPPLRGAACNCTAAPPPSRRFATAPPLLNQHARLLLRRSTLALPPLATVSQLHRPPAQPQLRLLLHRSTLVLPPLHYYPAASASLLATAPQLLHHRPAAASPLRRLCSTSTLAYCSAAPHWLYRRLPLYRNCPTTTITPQLNRNSATSALPQLRLLLHLSTLVLPRSATIPQLLRRRLPLHRSSSTTAPPPLRHCAAIASPQLVPTAPALHIGSTAASLRSVAASP